MSHVTRDELHPLFYALERHHRGDALIKDVPIDEELGAILARVTRDDSRELQTPQRLLTEDRVRVLMRHTATCNECQMLVYEEGPYAKRPATEEELSQQQGLLEEEERQLARRFWLSAGGGIVSFVGANISLREARKIQMQPTQGEGPNIGGVQGFQLHPLHMLFVLLLIIAAFCFAESWRTANLLWLDWTRAKEAVPLIGKRWAAASKRKQEAARKKATEL